MSVGWRTIVVTQHSKISYSGRRILVQTDGDTKEVPIDDIQVLLVATTQAVITTTAISELSKMHIKIIFTGDDGQPVCETVDYYVGNRSNDLLIRQFNWNQDRKELLWTKIVNEKIMMQINVVAELGLDTNGLISEFDQIEINDTSNREAIVAKKYFELLFNKNFSRRNFSPENAALNYGYSILLSTVNQEITLNGYLTQLGIHHHSAQNDFNFGSDLMEPFRPIIDLWVRKKKIRDLTPDIKYGLIELLNLEIIFNGERCIVRNALTKHVRNCCLYLSGETDQIRMEVNFTDEVSNNAINGNV